MQPVAGLYPPVALKRLHVRGCKGMYLRKAQSESASVDRAPRKEPLQPRKTANGRRTSQANPSGDPFVQRSHWRLESTRNTRADTHLPRAANGTTPAARRHPEMEQGSGQSCHNPCPRARRCGGTVGVAARSRNDENPIGGGAASNLAAGNRLHVRGRHGRYQGAGKRKLSNN